MQTSYFAKVRNSPKLKLVSVSRTTPPNFQGVSCFEVAPPSDLLWAFKNKQISEEEYETRYRAEVLSHIDAQQFYETYKDCVLCCWESPNKFCHRHIISSWLSEQLGVVVEEL